jgi:hypothetical protein
MLATFILVAGLACGQPAAAPAGRSPAKSAESSAELKAAVAKLVRQLDDTQLAQGASGGEEIWLAWDRRSSTSCHLSLARCPPY